MSGYYAQNPHYLAPDHSEERESIERREAEASSWFWDLVKPQRQRLENRLAANFPHRNTPRGEREHEAALREWKEATAEAERVHSMALADLMATGEVSEATNEVFERVKAGLPALPV